MDFDFGAQVALLARYRESARKASEAQRRMMDEFKATPAWIEAQELSNTTSKAVADTEATLRFAAELSYTASGEKHPHAAIGIRVVSGLEYPDDAALAYAREHLPQALTLNKREFEKVAKVVDLDFVRCVERPQATIATDLSQWAGGRDA